MFGVWSVILECVYKNPSIYCFLHYLSTRIVRSEQSKKTSIVQGSDSCRQGCTEKIMQDPENEEKWWVTALPPGFNGPPWRPVYHSSNQIKQMIVNVKCWLIWKWDPFINEVKPGKKLITSFFWTKWKPTLRLGHHLNIWYGWEFHYWMLARENFTQLNISRVQPG